MMTDRDVHSGTPRYCPNCGVEYRPGFERCSDCDVPLVDESPVETAAPRPEMVEWSELTRTGRRIDADLMRSFLEAHGIHAEVWSGGMGVWRMESGLTEMTGVPNDFNSHRVMVPPDELEAAQALVDAQEGVPVQGLEYEPDFDGGSSMTLMNLLRQRWLLVALVVFMLFAIVFFYGPNW